MPAVAWWPGTISPLSLSDETTMTMDLLPTVMDILEIEIHTSGPNQIDGVSLAPLLTKGDKLPDRSCFWRMDEEKAVRDGDWKLVINEDQTTELYNLKDDIGEVSDLSGQNPDKLQQLQQLMVSWGDEYSVTCCDII